MLNISELCTLCLTVIQAACAVSQCSDLRNVETVCGGQQSCAAVPLLHRGKQVTFFYNFFHNVTKPSSSQWKSHGKLKRLQSASISEQINFFLKKTFQWDPFTITKLNRLDSEVGNQRNLPVWVRMAPSSQWERITPRTIHAMQADGTVNNYDEYFFSPLHISHIPEWIP